jgi:hypothetical protein
MAYGLMYLLLAFGFKLLAVLIGVFRVFCG